MKKTIHLTVLALKLGGFLRVYLRNTASGFTNEHYYCQD